MANKNKSRYMLGIFIVFSIIILIAHYYFFVHRTIILEEVSPDNKYNIKCYAGPEYNQALIVFESNLASKSIELSIENDRKPIKASNFDITWQENGALIVISADSSEISPIELEFKVDGDDITSNVK